MPDLPSWTASITTRDGVTTVALTGELDLAVADELQRLLVSELDAPGTTTVVVDLADVSFLDSAGLGSFVTAYNHAVAAGHRFQLSNPVRAVRRILDISGVYDILGSPAAPGDR